MKMRPTSPAVVIGLELNGLGVARSLAKAGVHVIGLDVDPTAPGARTRHARFRAIRAFSGQHLVDDLLDLASNLPNRPVLFATKEATVATLSAARDMLVPHYCFLLPQLDTLSMLTNKLGFQEAAIRAGAPIPPAITLSEPADIRAAAALTYPCVLKPDHHATVYEARFRKAYKVDDADELARLYAEIHTVHPRMIVQEWIEGADSDIYFCLQYRSGSGCTLANFTGRKIRTWPTQTGGTASCVAAPEVAAELNELTDHFFSTTGCVGFAAMEYKRDRRSGRFLMVEPTVGRTDYQAEVATLNGVNLPLTAYNHLTGLALPVFRQPPQIRIWRDPMADAQAAEIAGDGSMPAGRVVDAWLRLDDPMPWIAVQWRRLKHRLRRASPHAG